MKMYNEDLGYCPKCGTHLVEGFGKTEKDWYGHEYHVRDIYCPHCRKEEEIKKRIKEEQRAEKIRKQEEERKRKKEQKRQERLKKYIKYMPKKVTSIVLMTNEAEYLINLLSKERNKNDDPMIEVLYKKLEKAKEDTHINLTESYNFAKEKGWEK